ncbi:hypothetical protein SALBM217S_04877 [Streptomyces griseoloalbus]
MGDGKGEDLTDDRLHVLIHRVVGDTDDDRRTVVLRGIGARWADEDLRLDEAGLLSDVALRQGVGQVRCCPRSYAPW